jgi:hypothetical protein
MEHTRTNQKESNQKIVVVLFTLIQTRSRVVNKRYRISYQDCLSEVFDCWLPWEMYIGYTCGLGG